MISKFVYNNSKKKTVILIHGLFANSGFWLKYLFFLRNYRLVVYNIDYNAFLKNNYKNCDLYFNSFRNNSEENIVAVISHSFGTVLADLFFGKRNLLLFNICPVAFGNRINSIGFVYYISNKLTLPSFIVRDTLINVDSFICSIKSQLSCGGINIVPTNDLYFTYNLNLINRTLFNGDHFNVEEAISNVIIYELNKLKCNYE